MKKKLSFIVLVLFLPVLIFAQKEGDKIKIAILDFANPKDAQGNTLQIVAHLQELVATEFTNRQKFIILDRSAFAKVNEEINTETNESFVNSKLVETGRQYGAQYIVTGIVTQGNWVQTQVPVNAAYPYGAQKAAYTVNISFSVKLIDIGTGQSTFDQTITCSNTGNTAVEALNSDYDIASCRIKYAILKMFPADIHIIKLDEIDGRGRLKKVLIDRGEDLFSENTAHGGPCDNGGKADQKKGFEAFTALFNKKKGTTLSVIQIEVLNVNGKEYKREKEIGQLEVEKIEGPVTSCIVKNGDKEIKDSFNAGVSLVIKIL
jgi:hypothetical protein